MNEHACIGIYASPLAGGLVRGGVLGRFFAHYCSVLLPRDEAYMRALFLEHYPTGLFIDVNSDPNWSRHVSGATSVVLLYPDPLGFGFLPIERAARASMSAHGSLRALTGRRRHFLLCPSTRVHLYLRRVLTRCLVAEIILGGMFILATPGMACIDWMRGRT